MAPLTLCKSSSIFTPPQTILKSQTKAKTYWKKKRAMEAMVWREIKPNEKKKKKKNQKKKKKKNQTNKQNKNPETFSETCLYNLISFAKFQYLPTILYTFSH